MLAHERHALQVVRRAREITRAARVPGPPFAPERYAARCGLELPLAPESRFPPHTPQWNGVVAIALARTLLPPGAGAGAAERLAELAAAEFLLPMHAFRRVAKRTDLTLDGVRDLAMRFAAPIRLTVRQWLQVGTWRGFALLWREEQGVLRLRWRAASPDARFPRTATVGVAADVLWSSGSRLYATHRTGRPHHGVEEVRTDSGLAWWFTRFGVVRDDGGCAAAMGDRSVLALVTLTRG
jgi:hypothetical protein